jgi:hypothetical protein
MGLAANWPPTASAAGLHRLNVLIHGMFVIDVGKDEIKLYPPDVSGHTFKAGTQGAMNSIRRGVNYHLAGLKSHTRLTLAELQPLHIGVFPRHAVNTKLAFCEISLPMPDKVSPARQEQAVPGQAFFEGTPKPYKQPDSLADLLIFTYEHVAGPVQFAPLPWVPTPKNGIANLDIWAMPDGPVPSNHPEEAFSTLAGMMGYPQLRMNPYYEKKKVPAIDKNPGVLGVTPKDEMDMVEVLNAKAQKNQVHILDYQGSLTCASAILY